MLTTFTSFWNVLTKCWSFGLFWQIFSKNRPLADSFIESRCPFVCLSLFMQFFSRPLIGPQITRSDPGLSLVDPPCFFLLLLILPYKTCWKPRFPMDYRPLVEGYIANIGISLDVFEFLRFIWFFPFFKKIGFLGILGPPYCGVGATIRIGREMLCLPYAGFFIY